MGKGSTLLKLILGGAAVGAVAAVSYSYVKNYKKLAPTEPEVPTEGETEKRGYAKIDMNRAKEAAVQTITDIKDGSVKAWNTAKGSAKAVGDVVMENYGDSINATKEKVSEAAKNVKEFAVDKAGIVKGFTSDKMDVVKEKAGETWQTVKENMTEQAKDAKAQIKESYETFRNENPKVAENIDKLKNTAQEAFSAVKEKVSEFFESNGEVEVVGDDGDFAEEVCDACEKAAEAVSEVVEEVTEEVKPEE